MYKSNGIDPFIEMTGIDCAIKNLAFTRDEILYACGKNQFQATILITEKKLNLIGQ